MMNGSVCRAARGLLNWSTRKLASQSDVAVREIFDLERERPIQPDSILRLAGAFESAGVSLIYEAEQAVGVQIGRAVPPDDGGEAKPISRSGAR